MQVETLSLRITKGESRALRLRAHQEGISRTKLVRRALRAYGIAPEADAEKTGYDLIKHIIGRNSGGPKDLSTNQRHMVDYGK